MQGHIAMRDLTLLYPDIMRLLIGGTFVIATEYAGAPYY